jgi:hypothetical protein
LEQTHCLIEPSVDSSDGRSRSHQDHPQSKGTTAKIDNKVVVIAAGLKLLGAIAPVIPRTRFVAASFFRPIDGVAACVYLCAVAGNPTRRGLSRQARHHRVA